MRQREETVEIDGRNRVLLGKKAVGYIQDGSAFIDPTGQCMALNRLLMPRVRHIRFEKGLADRMEHSETRFGTGNTKRVRVWQLRPETDPLIKFAAYDEVVEQRGGIEQDCYHPVYDGDCGADDPEEVWQALKNKPPAGYRGHQLTRSDVLELYGPGGSEFYYIDTQQLRPVEFDPPEPELRMT